MAAGSSLRLLEATARRRSATPSGAKASMILSLRARREELGISQPQMADRMGLSREHFLRLENGDRDPSVDTLFRWVHLLGGSLPVTFQVTASASDDAPDVVEAAE